MQRTSLPARRRLFVATASLVAAPALALLAACGGGASSGTTSTTVGAGASPSAASPAATFPVTVTADNGSVTIPARPTKIVSLSAADTEILYAIGAGAQVVAVDDQSNHPQGVPTTKLSGYKPNAEAVAAYAPDLVVLSNDDNGIVKALTKLKVPTLVLGAPTTLEASYGVYQTLGRATGHEAEAAAVVEQVKKRIAAAVASVPKGDKPLKVYHELDQTLYSATSKTFIGSVYSLFGLQNIADAAKGADSGYPQLSAEYVVEAAPDLVVLADTKCCQQSAATLAKRPAFSTLPAVKNGKVIEANDDIVSRWGPRVADFAELVAKELGGK
jgi:iron complex transport system substrate-binding protein